MSTFDSAPTQLLPVRLTAESLARQAASQDRVLHAATLVILHEHATICRLLDGLSEHLHAPSGAEGRPDFEAMRALLSCLAEFPEQQHHRKESELLFPKLRARAPMTRRLLDRLEDEHDQGLRWLRELENALLRFELMGEPRREPFERLVLRYTQFQHGHMDAEEQQLLPLAEQFLAGHDWQELNLAFAAGPGRADALAECDTLGLLAGQDARARAGAGAQGVMATFSTPSR